MSFNIVFILVVLATALFIIFLVDFFRKREDIAQAPSELVPTSEDLPNEGWKVLKEEKLLPEEVAWENVAHKKPSAWGFDGAFLRVFARESERVAFCIIELSSSEKAIEAFSGILEEQKKLSYPISMGDESVGLYKERIGIDATFFRVGSILALVLLSGENNLTQRRSVRYGAFLADNLQ